MPLTYDLAAVLRAEGLTVVEEAGWQRRGYDTLDPDLLLIHHTATGPKVSIAAMRRLLVTHGRKDLAAPLCNLWLRRSGAVHVVAAERARHAGKGSGVVLKEARAGKAPSGSAAARRLVDDTDGNRRAIGVECENDGTGERWSAEQVDALIRIGAAVCRAQGWGAHRVIGHAEWTRRKIDPHGLPMGGLRTNIDHRIGTPAATPTRADRGGRVATTWEEALVARLPTLAKGAGSSSPNPHVRRMQALLQADGSKVQQTGVFEASTANALVSFQRRRKITADGVCGRGTWSHLLGILP